MKYLKFILLNVFIMSHAISCIPTDDGSDGGSFRGTIEDVEDFYTPETVQAIKDLGFVINEGNNPPNVQGVYIFDSLVFEETNIPDDIDFSNEFRNVRFAISNQDNKSLTLDFKGYSGTSKTEVLESFISGEGDLFTIYLKTLSTDLSNNSEGVFARTYSGRKTQQGFQNFSSSLMMLDDSRDFSNIFIDNNQGRKFTDGDGLVKLVCPIGNGDFDGSLNSLYDIFPQNAIQTIQRLGIKVNEGNSPPSLSGPYFFDPLLAATTRTGQDDNVIFKDLFDIRLTAKNNQNLELSFDAKEGFENNSEFEWLQGVKSYISGSGNKFTVFSKVFSYDNNVNYQHLSLHIYSGTLNSAGNIDDFTYGLYMIDDAGDPNSKFIENGDARYFTNQNTGKSFGLNKKITKESKNFSPTMESKKLNIDNSPL